MLFELRMYHIEPGRSGAVIDRMDQQIPALFERHGIPMPLAKWLATSGGQLPLYVWLVCWPDMSDRQRAFDAFYADPEWQRVRNVTNGGRPTVHATRYWFMQSIGQCRIAEQTSRDAAYGLHEIRVYRIAPGRQARALRGLHEADLPALERAGAAPLGLFDLQSGELTPAIVIMTAWRDFGARRLGLEAWESDPAVRDARSSEISEFNAHALGPFDSWLLEPLP